MVKSSLRTRATYDRSSPYVFFIFSGAFFFLFFFFFF